MTEIAIKPELAARERDVILLARAVEALVVMGTKFRAYRAVFVSFGGIAVMAYATTLDPWQLSAAIWASGLALLFTGITLIARRGPASSPRLTGASTVTSPKYFYRSENAFYRQVSSPTGGSSGNSNSASLSSR